MDDIKHMFDVNLFGPIGLTQRFLLLIRGQQVSDWVDNQLADLFDVASFLFVTSRPSSLLLIIGSYCVHQLSCRPNH